MKTIDEKLTYINQLSRKQAQDILEANGFAVYDTETDEKLREALRVNVEDGTIELRTEPRTVAEIIRDWDAGGAPKTSAYYRLLNEVTRGS